MSKSTATTFNCLNCGDPKTLPLWQVKKRLFCGKVCASKYNMNKVTTRLKIFSKLHSVESKAKQKEALKTPEYSKLRSELSKNVSEKSRLKSRETMLTLHEKIHNDPIWKNAASESAKKRIKEGKFGGGIPGSKVASKGLMFGKKTVHERTGIVMRSTWERDFANLLDRYNISWKYEPKQFKLGFTNYTPDFRIIGKNLFIDVKPKRRFVLQSDKITRYKRIKKYFSENNMKLWFLDKEDFGKAISIINGGGLLQY